MNHFNTLSFRDEVLEVAFLFCTQHLRLILKSSANARSQAKPLLGETHNGTMWLFLNRNLFLWIIFSWLQWNRGNGPCFLEKAAVLAWPMAGTRQPWQNVENDILESNCHLSKGKDQALHQGPHYSSWHNDVTQVSQTSGFGLEPQTHSTLYWSASRYFWQVGSALWDASPGLSGSLAEY